MPTYRHRQMGWGMLILFAAIFVFTLVLLIVSRVPWLVSIWLVGILALALLSFGWITTTVDEQRFLLTMGVGLIRRNTHLSEIRACTVVHNPWYYSLGIHLTPHGWLYNLSTGPGVEIELRDGKTFRVGSNDAEGLAAAIHAALQ